MARTVHCAKFNKELPGLESPPIKGELGERIYENVSQQAWELWRPQSTLIINHYGLSMADPEARTLLKRQMEEFFFGEDAQMPEGWTPPSMGKGGFAPAMK
jgi:Fe-S cluster biosynthesis and repair protein YggX